MNKDLTYYIKIVMRKEHKDSLISHLKELEDLGFKVNDVHGSNILMSMYTPHKTYDCLKIDMILAGQLTRTLWKSLFPYEIYFTSSDGNIFLFEQRFISTSLKEVYKTRGLSQLTIIDNVLSDKAKRILWIPQLDLLKQYKTLQLLKGEK